MQSENQYLHFSEIDFATDAAFILWVKREDEQSNQFWDNFLSRYPEKHETVMRAKRLVMSVRFEEAEWSEQSMVQLKEKILSGLASDSVRKRGKLRRMMIKVSKVAAVVAVTIAGIYIWSSQKSYPEDPVFSYASNGTDIKVIYLPDSTKVILNANSTFTYKFNSRKRIREANLKGEAYLQVKRDPDAPFTMQFQALKLQVLGTAFNVKTGADSTTIALESGKVRLTVDDHGTPVDETYIDLLPGQVAAYSGNGKNINRRTESIERYTTWKNDVISFDQASLKDVAAIVKQRFNLDMIIPEDMHKQTFSADIIVQNNDITLLLRLLEESFQLNSTIKNDSIILSRR
ncbi:MAG TPA: FecR domain-containing protein [Parasegetibacter sp.]